MPKKTHDTRKVNRARRRAKVQRLVEKAENLAKSGHFGEAQRVISEIPKIPGSKGVAKKVRRNIHKIHEKVQQREAKIQSQVEDAKNLAKSGQVEQALQIIITIDNKAIRDETLKSIAKTIIHAEETTQDIQDTPQLDENLTIDQTVNKILETSSLSLTEVENRQLIQGLSDALDLTGYLSLESDRNTPLEFVKNLTQAADILKNLQSMNTRDELMISMAFSGIASALALVGDARQAEQFFFQSIRIATRLKADSSKYHVIKSLATHSASAGEIKEAILLECIYIAKSIRATDERSESLQTIAECAVDLPNALNFITQIPDEQARDAGLSKLPCSKAASPDEAFRILNLIATQETRCAAISDLSARFRELGFKEEIKRLIPHAIDEPAVFDAVLGNLLALYPDPKSLTAAAREFGIVLEEESPSLEVESPVSHEQDFDHLISTFQENPQEVTESLIQTALAMSGDGQQFRTFIDKLAQAAGSQALPMLQKLTFELQSKGEADRAMYTFQLANRIVQEG